MDRVRTGLVTYRTVMIVRPFRLLLLGQGLSMIGDAVCLAALPIALIRLDYDGRTFGFVMAAVGLGTVLGAGFGGILADRRSPKFVFIGTDAARGTTQVLSTALIASHSAWWGVVLCYFIFGTGIGVARPCAQVLLTNVLPKDALIAGNGLMHFVDNLVAVVFPSTVGVLIILWNPIAGIFIDALTFFASAAISGLLPNVGIYGGDSEFSIREAFSGLSVLRRDPRLRLGFFATIVLTVLCFPVFLVVAPYAISDRFSESLWGICLAASGLGACVGSVIVVIGASDRRLIHLAIVCGLFLSGAMALLGLSSYAWLAVLGASFVGLVEASWLTGWSTAMQTLTPEGDLGRVVAIDTVATGGTLPFIYLGGGLVGSFFGYSYALVIASVVSVVGTVIIGFMAALSSVFRAADLGE